MKITLSNKMKSNNHKNILQKLLKLSMFFQKIYNLIELITNQEAKHSLAI